MENYEKVKKIGRGTYGDVILVKRKTDGAMLALKKVALENLQSSSSSGRESRSSNLNENANNFAKNTKFTFQVQNQFKNNQNNNQHNHQSVDSNKSNENSSEETHRALNNEIQILKTLDHPNIIKYHESFVYKKQLCIITEFAENGDLYRKIKEAKNGKKYDQEQILDWFCQLALAINHIHQKNIIHRDLKPKNILLDKRNQVKIGDFGISKMLENTFDMANTATGTPFYLSPEVCLGQKYDHKSDMWMLGCVLYEMCMYKRVFEGDSLQQVLNQITKMNYPKLPNEFAPLFHHLVDVLLQKTAMIRASIQEILSIPEIQEHIKKMSEKAQLLQNSEQEDSAQNTPALSYTSDNKRNLNLKQIQYIKPLSQKKHAQQDKRSKSKINNFLEANVDEQLTHGRNNQSEINPNHDVNVHQNDLRQQSKSFQGEITFGERLIESQKRNSNELKNNNPNQVYEQYLDGYLNVPNAQNESFQSFQGSNQGLADSEVQPQNDQDVQIKKQSQPSQQYANMPPNTQSQRKRQYNSKTPTQFRQRQLPKESTLNINTNIGGASNSICPQSNQEYSGYSNELDDLPRSKKKHSNPQVTSSPNSVQHGLNIDNDQLLKVPTAGGQEYSNSRQYENNSNRRKNSQDSSKSKNKQQKIQDLLNKAKNLTSPNQSQHMMYNSSQQNLNNQYRTTNNRSTLSKVSNENTGFNGSQISQGEYNDNAGGVAKTQQQSKTNLHSFDNIQQFSNQSEKQKSAQQSAQQSPAKNFNFGKKRGKLPNNDKNKNTAPENVPLFQESEENQDLDELNSEQIGKRKTIHSMSALSMNQRVSNNRDMMFIDDNFNGSTGAQMPGNNHNNNNISASESQLQRNKQLVPQPNATNKAIFGGNKGMTQQPSTKGGTGTKQQQLGGKLKSQSNDEQIFQSYSNQINNSYIMQEDFSGKQNQSSKIPKKIKQQVIRNQNKTVMKINHNNNSEIEVHFPQNRKKLNYMKSIGKNTQNSNKIEGGKKQIQINTNLEPNQSKKQYELALVQAKLCKQTSNYNNQTTPIDKTDKQIKDKKNNSSISCGSITVNISANEKIKGKYEKQIESKTVKNIQMQRSQGQNNFQSINSDQNVNNDSQNQPGGKQQSLNMSQISPAGSFYTPNSFYQQPNFQQNFLKFNNYDGGLGSGKSYGQDQIQIKQNSNIQSKNIITKQLSNIKIPQHPKTITNMNISKVIGTQSGDFGEIQANINLNKFPFSSDKKSLQDFQNNQLNQPNEGSLGTGGGMIGSQMSSNMSKQFSSGSDIKNISNNAINKQIAKTPQDHVVKKGLQFNTNLSGSAGGGMQGKGQFGGQMMEDGKTGENFINYQQVQRKPINTASNMIVNSSKKLLNSNKKQNINLKQVQQSQSKYFTFDGNVIFNPKNPVSPARGHLAYEFLMKQIGNDTYNKVLQILQECEDPIRLLRLNEGNQKSINDSPLKQGSGGPNWQKMKVIKETQNKILKLLNNDPKYLQVFEYIVNCQRHTAKTSNYSAFSANQSSSNISQPNSGGNAEHHSQFSQQHTPNSILTNNTNNSNKIYMQRNTHYPIQQIYKKQSYDSTYDAQNGHNQYSNASSSKQIQGANFTQAQQMSTSTRNSMDTETQGISPNSTNLTNSGGQLQNFKSSAKNNQLKHFTPSSQYTNNLMDNDQIQQHTFNQNQNHAIQQKNHLYQKKSFLQQNSEREGIAQVNYALQQLTPHLRSNKPYQQPQLTPNVTSSNINNQVAQQLIPQFENSQENPQQFQNMFHTNKQGKQYGKTPQHNSKRQNIQNDKQQNSKKLFKKRDISFEKYKIKVGPDQNILSSNDQSSKNNDQSPIEDGISPYSLPYSELLQCNEFNHIDQGATSQQSLKKLKNDLKISQDQMQQIIQN